jgi:ferredoxin
VEGASTKTPARVTIDPDLCIGSGDCVRLLPGAFQLDKHRGVSTPLPGAATADADLLAEAEFNCPTHAIQVAGQER